MTDRLKEIRERLEAATVTSGVFIDEDGKLSPIIGVPKRDVQDLLRIAEAAETAWLAFELYEPEWKALGKALKGEPPNDCQPLTWLRHTALR